MIANSVSGVDRFNVVERVRSAVASVSGGTPSYKRRRGIYRALKRKDFKISIYYATELAYLNMFKKLQQDLFGSGDSR